MTWTETILLIAFWGNAALLLYVYWGYGALLRLLLALRQDDVAPPATGIDKTPPVTVLLTVHNEESAIEARLDDLVQQTYPADRMTIVVASDGSTDRTEQIVEAFVGRAPVRLVRTARVGKSAAQNAAIRSITDDIVVFTDAATRFDCNFLREIAGPLIYPSIGCVTGNVQFTGGAPAMAGGQSVYWTQEQLLRERESRLGILAVASGQAMALRRALWQPLPAFAGDDCIIPLAIVSQGYKVVHNGRALAFDVLPADAAAEFRARMRMTMRNWTGTWLYAALLNPVRQPGYAFALWSHKLLRWLGSLALLAMAAAALALLILGTPLPAVILALGGATALAGWFSTRCRVAVPLAPLVFSFALANAGFLAGLLAAWSGRKISRYDQAGEG